MARNVDLDKLHPVVREKVQALITQLDKENIPLRLFEGYRFPQRQHQLYSKGRTTPGKRVTKADAWSSYHQYGMACDFVLYIDGKWSWQTRGKYAKYWKRYQEIGVEVGLKPLSWELPHLQLHNLNLASLRNGDYPEGGDESWSENLRSEIENWTKTPTPPPPPLIFERPPLDDDDIDQQVQEEEPTIDTGTTNSKYRVTARSGLRMRAGPSTGFDIISSLAPQQIVSVIGESGDWLQVDLESDGLADGYCHSGFLKQIT